MDAKQFLAEFGHIANAPGGVARLREMVLALAVQGKLLAQDPTDSLENELLKGISSGNHDVLRNSKSKLPKTLTTISPNEMPFEKPQGWEWARLGDIAEIERGGSPRPIDDFLTNDPDGLNWIKIGDTVKGSKFITSTREKIKKEGLVKTRMVYPGDFLLTNSMSFGRPYITTIEGCIHDGWLRIHPPSCLEKDYLYHLLSSPIVANFFLKAAAGAVVQNLNADKVRELPIPLPPLAEQSRIVTKVDELMALCDKLELQQQQRRNLQNNLRQSTLQAVGASTSPHELQLAWTFLEENFSRLFQVPEDINEFIANLKDLAVLGLLAKVTSDQSDLTEIISACSTLRSEYVSSGLMRKQKLILNVEHVELNYPEHWAVIPFDEVAVVIGGVTKGRDLRGKDVVTCPYLSVANVQRGFFKLDQLKTIQITKAELTKYQVLEGDLLITEGGDWDKVGRTAIWKGGIDNCLHQNHVFKARVPSERLLNEWVELIFNSGIGRNYFAGASKQTTNLASINMTQLRSFPLPIPPLAEQRNILKNLDVMTAFCQSWRNQLEHKQKLAALFATAVTSSFTGITTEPEENEPLKAPKPN
ncbi:restriction endonuclease subunit S [Methylicorpusculum oleiharenae]|uniref:restriction endonuclease subunit S n=1 Tax=Methylicorpusculum oleiharenae TaxID=1338687 RepID=UPI0019CFAB7A|nr:restriction endonuclease subunit S [Methylicorpusculum oleiharenae]MCD2450282.1 restriction endonuclease subunit S [Methylicorpusculum oleiharenae]